MSPSRALALLEPVLSALAAAHRAGLIHRDIKPENVLIADDGRVKVADFGLAKAVSTDTQHTATGGVLIGTVSYLAPELVVDGRSDARADVYAAGRGDLRAAHRPQAARGRVADPGRLQARARGRPGPVGDRPRPPGVRRRAGRARHGPRPRPAARRRRRAPAPAAPRQPGAGLRGGRRPRAGRRPDADARRRRATCPTSRTPPHWLDTSDLEDVRTEAPRVGNRTTAVPVLAASVVPAPRPGIDRLPAPRPDARPVVVAPRRSRRGPITLLLALLLVAALAGGAWWFGSGRYTTTPGVLGLEQAAAETELDPGRARRHASATRRTPRASPPASWSPPTPIPATGSSTAAPSRWCCPPGPSGTPCPRSQGQTLDQAQDALLSATWRSARRSRSSARRCPRAS